MRLLPAMSTGSTGAAVTAACRTSERRMPGQQGRFGAFLTGRDRGYLVESGRVAEWQQNRRGTSYHTYSTGTGIYLPWVVEY